MKTKHTFSATRLAPSLCLLMFSSGAFAIDLAKLLPSASDIGLKMSLNPERLATLPERLVAVYMADRPADGSHPEQLAVSVRKVKNIQRAMELSTDSRYRNALGQAAKDYSSEFSATEWKLVSNWTPGHEGYSLKLTAYLPVTSASTDGWVISVLWTSTNGKLVKGKPDGRRLTKDDLAVAAKLIEKFIQNGRKEGWPK
jgi:hypothetical protein